MWYPHLRLRQGDSILRDLAGRERSWQDGITLLAEVRRAGKNDEAIGLTEEAPNRGLRHPRRFYERARRWNESATAHDGGRPAAKH